MTTYYVDGQSGNDASGNGSSNSPWKTLNKAHTKIAPGDEVRIRTATYREELAIQVRNTTWRADTGHRPVIDGRYHDGLFQRDGTLPHPEPGSGYLPDNLNNAMINIRATGVTLDGLTLQNLAGSAIGVTESGCTIRNCRLDFIYRTGLRVNAGGSFIEGTLIENNVLTRLVQRLFDPLREGLGPDAAGAAMTLVRVRDGIVRNNVIAFSMGEGIDLDKGSYRLIAEGNVVHSCNHIHIYINRSIDAIIRNNLIFHLQTPEYVGQDGTVPTGICIGDERPRQGGEWPNSAGGQIYNNIVVGMGKSFQVRNGPNYDTQLVDCYIGYNTFVGGNRTTDGIQIAGNNFGRRHAGTLVENNIIVGADRISHATGDISGVAFRNNLWGEPPIGAMRGDGDRIGNPNLVNPSAAIRGDFPQPETNVEPRNYQLSNRSALAIGRASDGQRMNGLLPPAIRKDFFGASRDGQPDIGAHEFAGVAAGITANFSIGPGQIAGALPHTVDFTDKSVAARPIIAWQWDFGDGETATETNPSHTYDKAGTFDVTLTVTDDQGNSDSLTRNDLVTVVADPNVVVPDSFRRFVLVQTDNQRVLSYGVQYPDQRCILIWNDEPFHILNYADIEDVERTAAVGQRELRWIDPLDQGELMLEMELEEAA